MMKNPIPKNLWLSAECTCVGKIDEDSRTMPQTFEMVLKARMCNLCKITRPGVVPHTLKWLKILNRSPKPEKGHAH
ncbi:hypothetical protein TNCT_217751 [Trichonephila clavata]|uniref:Uncharacterized protein n=1 Tax=Trichonephila clavata TaxID=2740835 RepID=A0A8X6FMW1_TRICU|nr:hypothetical protein TNCT_217751 [Trichonephila clavata]